MTTTHGSQAPGIVVVITALPLWSLGGKKGGPALSRTISALAGRGYEVHLVSPHAAARGHSDLCTDHAVPMPDIGWQSPLPCTGFLYRAAWDELFRRRALAIARRIASPDRVALIYGYEVQGVPPARDLADRCHCPLITRFQGTILAPWLHRSGWRVRFWSHWRALRTRAEAVIMTDDGTQGDQVLHHLHAWGPHVRFWRNGVERFPTVPPQRAAELRKELGIGPSDRCLLTVSRLASWKRVDRAIAMMPQLLAQASDCHLIIVGDGEARPALERQAQDSGVAHRVHFTGAVAREQLAGYYALADVFLSLYDLSNLGNPLFEAMSSHRCVVTLDVGDTRTVIRHEENGILLKVDEVPRLPEVVGALLRQPEQRQRLAAAAAAFAEANLWTWEQRMEAEMSLVDELTRASRTARADSRRNGATRHAGN